MKLGYTRSPKAHLPPCSLVPNRTRTNTSLQPRGWRPLCYRNSIGISHPNIVIRTIGNSHLLDFPLSSAFHYNVSHKYNVIKLLVLKLTTLNLLLLT